MRAQHMMLIHRFLLHPNSNDKGESKIGIIEATRNTKIVNAANLWLTTIENPRKT